MTCQTGEDGPSSCQENVTAHLPSQGTSGGGRCFLDSSPAGDWLMPAKHKSLAIFTFVSVTVATTFLPLLMSNPSMKFTKLFGFFKRIGKYCPCGCHMSHSNSSMGSKKPLGHCWVIQAQACEPQETGHAAGPSEPA